MSEPLDLSAEAAKVLEAFVAHCAETGNAQGSMEALILIAARSLTMVASMVEVNRDVANRECSICQVADAVAEEAHLIATTMESMKTTMSYCDAITK